MKRTFLIKIAYAGPTDVMGDGREAIRLTAELYWIAETPEAARIWAHGLSGCLDLIEVTEVLEVRLT